MKKILLALSVAIVMALFSAPSYVKAFAYDVGVAVRPNGDNDYLVVNVFCKDDVSYYYVLSSGGNKFQNNNGWNLNYSSEGYGADCDTENCILVYLNPSHFRGSSSFTLGGTYFTTDYEDFLSRLPEPEEPSVLEQLWDSFYDLFEDIFGYRPLSGSIYDLLRGNAEGDYGDITFITLTPTPSPTPQPTPIPVQTIFVPDGNGGTTIVYQYPDPTSGVITQSPYNPNDQINNNITVNCDCDGGGSGTFTNDPTDPYTLDASLLWADGFGVQMSDNPLSATNDSQQTLNDAAMVYDASVSVMSNSYNILPVKWLQLVGILGGILIIAGLIKTFLGG